VQVKALSLADARRALLTAVRSLPPEEVPLPEASGWTVQRTVVARVSLPPEDHATLDGYAVRVGDVAGSLERGLRLAGTVTAGLTAPPPLLPGHCMAVMTGAPVPPGTEAVVPLEATRCTGDMVQVASPPLPGSGIRKAGEEVKTGDVLILPGTLVQPRTLERLAAQGITQLPVSRQARVHVVATGDELVPPGQVPGLAQRVASNLPMLEALVRAEGGSLERGVVVPDDPERLREALAEAVTSDLLVTVGGTLRGAKDLTKTALAGIGAAFLFDGVAIRPGASCAAATLWNAAVVCLPGSPGAAYLGFAALGRPILRALHGRTSPMPAFTARLVEPLPPAAEETVLVAGVVQETAAGLVFHRRGQGWPALGLLAPSPAGSEPDSQITVELLSQG
jgi:molybdopterin molybdotransferase